MAESPKSADGKRSFAGRAVGGGFVVLGLLLCGGMVGPTVLSVAGDMAEVLVGVFILTVALAGQAVTTWWGWRRRSHWTRWILTQVPYLVVYVMLYVWYGVGWSIEDGGPPSLWFLPWAGVAGVAMSWLWVWWLDYGERRNPKRAIVFLSLAGVMVAGNGAAAAAVVLRATEGLGLRGPGTPEAAVLAMTANSCLFAHDWYHRGGAPMSADCPDWSNGPGTDLGWYLAGGQPLQALGHWYQRYRAFEALPRLHYEYPVVEHVGGAVTARLEVELPMRAEGQDLSALKPEERWCLPDGRQETWRILLESTIGGGWKVARLEIDNKIDVVPFKGSSCEAAIRPRR
jgi:hypothetical protein